MAYHLLAAIINYPIVFFALGYGGNGITFSLIAAEILTDLITGKKNKDASIFSLHRI
jgi:glycine/D-amino acid oxidase-like deaminating enzyme